MPRVGYFVALAGLTCVAAGPPHFALPPIAPIGPTDTPYLDSSRATARFADGALSGTVTWLVANRHDRPTAFSFAPPRVAWGPLRWDTGEPVRLSRIPPAGPLTDGMLAIEVPANGGALTGDWSARSTDERGAKRFDLRFPPAVVSTLDLTLPSSFRPVVRPEDALLTGPFPSGIVNESRWRLSFGGRDRLTVFVPTSAARTASVPGPVARSAKWVVGAARADGTVTFTPDRPYLAWDDILFELDPSVRIVSVTTDGPSTWRLDPPAGDRPSQTLRVRPLDPDGSSRVHVSLLAPPPSPDIPWPVPAVRPVARSPHEDTLTLRVNPSLRTTVWNSGDFRVTHADAGDAEGRVTVAEGSFGTGDDGDRRTPTITFSDPRPDVSVAERTTLTIDPTDRRAHVVAAVTVRRGPISSLRFTVPAPFRLAAPPAVMNDDGPERPDPQGPTYEVAFARPLGRGQTATIGFSLVAPTPPESGGYVRGPVPAVIWDGVDRTGTVSVRPSDAFEPAPPLLVAYQDLPPAGDVTLRVRRPVARPPDRHPQTIVPSIPENPVPPERVLIRVDTSGLDVTMTGPAATPVRIALPDGFKLETVRVAERNVGHAGRDGNSVLLPFTGGPHAKYEIRGRIGSSLVLFGRVRVSGIDPDPTAWDWVAEPGVRMIPRVNSAWVVRMDVLRAASLGLTLVLMVISIAALRRRPGAGLVLTLATAGLGTAMMTTTIGEVFRLPAAVAIVSLALTMGIRRVALIVPLAIACPALAAPPENAVIANATYRATESAEDVAVTAEWDVWNPFPDDRPVTVPLNGAKVVGIRLDDDAAFPEPLPAGGFRLGVGPGGHRIVTTIFVPVTAAGGERSIRFDGPDVPRGTFSFTASDGTTGVSVASRRGSQITNGAVTTANLGEGRTVILRWRPAVRGIGTRPSEPTKEQTVYVVGEGNATATTEITFPATRTGPRFRIVVPEGWSPDHVSVRAADTNTAVPSDWTMDATRTLIVTTRISAGGEVVVTVALTPDHPLTRTVALPVIRAVEGPDPRALYGVRLDRVSAVRWDRSGVIDWPADDVPRGPVTFATRKTDDPVRLMLTLSSVHPQPPIPQTWTWVLGRSADVTAEISVPNTVGPTIRFDVSPQIRVLSARCPDLLEWRRGEGHLEFDLVTERDGGPVRWVGTAGPLGAGDHSLPVPPGLRPAVVRIRPASGWTTRVVPAPGMSAVPNEPDTWTVGPQFKSVRVLVAEAPLSPSPSSPSPSPSPSPPPPFRSPTPIPSDQPVGETVSVTPASSTDFVPVAGWLTGLAAVAGLAGVGRGRFRPECVTGLGLLGWAAIGTGFAAMVALGLILRLVRTVGTA